MSNRRTQHREQRETNNQEIAGLKKEIEQLTRQVARLRKENDRLMSMDDKEGSPEPENLPIERLSKALVIHCPKCKSTDIGVLPLPSGKKVSACRSCKEWKSRPS